MARVDSSLLVSAIESIRTGSPQLAAGISTQRVL
jgi:hypothetical protein